MSLYTDANRARAAAIDAEAAKLQKLVNEKQAKYVDVAFEKELEKFPADMRSGLRLAFRTPEATRTTDQKTLDVARRETRDLVESEVRECGAEVIALREDRSPAQAGLEAFEAQLLEQPLVVVHREAPVRVVVCHVLRRGRTPVAALLAVGAGESLHASGLKTMK